MLNRNHTITARNAGIANREVAGKLMNGRISKTLHTKMNMNIEVRNGTQGSPAGPMTSITMPFRMKSTIASIAFCRPLGTTLGFRNASTNSTITTIPATTISPETRLKQLSPWPIRQPVLKIWGPISFCPNPPSLGPTNARIPAST